MHRLKPTCLALALLFAAPAAVAVEMCGGPCSVSIGFPEGGSISAPGGATITFGTDGGLLELGDGGSLTLGDGGSVWYQDGGPDNKMAYGGTVTLGPGGSITFGPGGALATSYLGGIAVADGAALDVLASGPVTIASVHAIGVGALDAGGSIHVTGSGDVSLGFDAPPINFSTTAGSAPADITITGGEIRSGAISATDSIFITATSVLFDAGEIAVVDGGAGGAPVLDPSGLVAGASISLDGTLQIPDLGLVIDEYTTSGGQIVALDVVPPESGGGGAIGPWGLLLGLAARRRRR